MGKQENIAAWSLKKEVHIWQFPTKESDFSLLAEEEKAFANKFHFEGDRNRFSVGRQGLRLLLSKYLSIDPSSISISTKSGEKPAVIGYRSSLNDQLSSIRFNITHSGEWVLIALSKEEVGIDIEYVNPAFEYKDLLEDHFSKVEQDFILHSKDPLYSFYYLWTRKEALTKAWGTGLQENMKEVPVIDLSSGIPSIERHGKLWQLESFKIEEHYAAAVASSRDARKIIYFNGNKILL